jgi:hypothetical protein
MDITGIISFILRDELLGGFDVYRQIIFDVVVVGKCIVF